MVVYALYIYIYICVYIYIYTYSYTYVYVIYCLFTKLGGGVSENAQDEASFGIADKTLLKPPRINRRGPKGRLVKA